MSRGRLTVEKDKKPSSRILDSKYFRKKKYLKVKGDSQDYNKINIK